LTGYLAEIKTFFIRVACAGKLLKDFSYRVDAYSVTSWAQEPFLMLAYAKKGTILTGKASMELFNGSLRMCCYPFVAIC